jgi:AraC-like DNA-binding protein
VTVNCGRRDVRVAEIAAVVGLSPRGLQFLCRRHFGRSPLRLLRDAGLHRVREAMDSAETAPATMAEAAAMAGFGRPDRFAAAYRARYGEDPRLPAGGGALPGPVNGGEQGGAGPVSATGTRTEAGAHVVGPAAGKGRGAGASTAGKEPGEFPHPGPVTRDCPLQCLLELLDLKAGNPLMRGRGIRVGPPETVGDVLDLYASRRLRDITGLGPRRIAQIAVALEAAGFDLRPRPCPRPGDGGRPAVSPAGKDPGS